MKEVTISTMATRKRQLTAGCLFSGMGGFASGLVKAGFTIRWASDKDEFACTTFRHRLPEVRVIEKDIRNLSVAGDNLAGVDVLAGGFPCQSFSQAGERRGFEDPRGKLFFEILRLLREMEVEKRPRFIILENVPHLLHGAAGAWFDEIQRSLRKAGYWFRRSSCLVANVKDVTDLPQDRKRLFMVAASREHFSYNPVAFYTSNRYANGTDRRSLSEFINRSQRGPAEAYLSQQNRYYKMIEQEMASGESIENIYQLRRSYVREKTNGLCPTLTANMGMGGHNVPFIRDKWGIRKLNVGEVAGLQGFGMHKSLFPKIPEKEKYRLIGNAVCVEFAYFVSKKCKEALNGSLS